jgi:hypothetical protein
MLQLRWSLRWIIRARNIYNGDSPVHTHSAVAATPPSRGGTMALRTAVLALSIGLLALPCLAGNTTSAGTITPSRPDWATGLTLMLSDVSTPSALHKAVEVIQSLGGRVSVINEPDIVFGWISPTQHAALLRSGFRAVSTDIVSPTALAGASTNTIEAARFLNAVSSGEFFTRASPAQSVPRGPDVVAPNPNIAADIFNDGMSGYVNVAMLFIESVYVPGVPGSEDLYSWDYQSFWKFMMQPGPDYCAGRRWRRATASRYTSRWAPVTPGDRVAGCSNRTSQFVTPGETTICGSNRSWRTLATPRGQDRSAGRYGEHVDRREGRLHEDMGRPRSGSKGRRREECRREEC